MYEYALVSIVYVISIIFSDLLKSKFWFSFGFGALYIFISVRCGFGNDYYAYEHIFNLITVDGDSVQGLEIGWDLFNNFFSQLGFVWLVAILSGIYIVSIALFLYRFAEYGFRWLGAVIFVLNPDLLLVNLSAMRQSLAISIFLYAVYCFGFFQKRTVFVSALATFVHISALVLAPLIIVAQKLTAKRVYSLFFPALYIIILILPIEELVTLFITNFNLFEKFNYYGSRGIVTSGFGMVFYFVLSVLLSLIVLRTANHSDRFVIFCCQYKLIFSAMVGSLSILSRFTLYFEPFFMLLLPVVFKKSDEKLLVYFIAAILILFYSYRFFLFFTDADNILHYQEYLTIFHD